MYQETGYFYIVDRSDPWEQFFFITSVLFLLSIIMFLFFGIAITNYQFKTERLQKENDLLKKHNQAYQMATQFSEQYGIKQLQQNPSQALSIAKTVRRFYCRALTEIAYKYNPNLTKKQTNIIVETIYNESIKYEFDPLEIAALIVQESGFDIRSTSHLGAMGLMQLMPDTAVELAKAVGIKYGDDQDGRSLFYQPEINIKLGILYLWDLRRSYPSLYLVGYYGGPGAANKLNAGYQFQEVLDYHNSVATRFGNFRYQYDRRMLAWN